jgi:hypothetical protein
MVQLAGSLDGGGAGVATPDLQKNASAAASAASIKSSDSYSITIENLPVKIFGSYNFVFQYLYLDDSQATTIDGPFSATYSVPANIPDLSVAPTNIVATGGYNSYQLKWDVPTFASYGDTVVYESNSALSAPSVKVVFIGTANQCTILTSDSLPKYVYIVHRDMFLDANKKGTPYGPITILEPVSVDTTGPSNVTSVTASGGVETGGIAGFNGFLDISWPAVTGNGIRGYRIRYKATGSTNYSYADSPGTGTAYRLTGLGVGLTYEIAVATYDEYNNTSTSYVAATNVAISGTPFIASTVNVTGYFNATSGGDTGAFKFGYGVDTGKRGLVFNANNYWYIDSSQSASLRVGGASTNYIDWNGTELKINGNLGVDGNTKIGGNIQLSTAGASIYNGTINSNGNLTGNGFALNSSGLKVASGSNSVTLDAASGQITANAGNIAGWALSANSLSNNNIVLDSAGSIIVGASNTNNTIRLSSSDTAANDGNVYRAWVGTQVASSVTPLRITREGKLYASGAEVSGTITASGGSITGDLAVSGNLNLTTGGIYTQNTGLLFGGLRINGANAAYEFLNDSNAIAGQMYTFNSGNEIIIQSGSSREGTVGYPASTWFQSIGPSGITLGLSDATGATTTYLNMQSGSVYITAGVSLLYNQSIAIASARNISAGTAVKSTSDSSGYIGDIYIQY